MDETSNTPGEGVGSRKTPLEQFQANPRSRKLAIKAKCWDCMGGASEPGVYRRIRECPQERTCPLWKFRPGAGK
jgi:hypothetical protein